MKPIEWNDKLSIDDGLIDEDHLLLLHIINQFREQVGKFDGPDEALEILESLKLYSQQHFGREEELQRAANFPFQEAHHSEHVHLMKKLDVILEETKAASGNYLNTVMGEKIGQFLREWLIDHVLDNDLRMKPYVTEMRDISKKMGKMKAS